jgi:16S rRNA (adenine1518-N6/adenine1519-N6)-dimethyltransferase
MLQEKFALEIAEKKLILINGDILKLRIENYELRKYKIIANIPYNITGAILKKFLTEKNQPEHMVLMVQHEVAKRIVASDKKESILSISVKAYGEPKMIMKVDARYFSPAPKVDSAIIAIKNISRKVFEKNGVDEEKFWEIVRAGFAHKRKMLAGNLKSLLGNHTSQILGQAKIKENARAEDISLEQWQMITVIKKNPPSA